MLKKTLSYVLPAYLLSGLPDCSSTTPSLAFSLKSSESSKLHTIVETSGDGRSGMCHGGGLTLVETITTVGKITNASPFRRQ